jgi:hypothetical protein
MLPVAVEIAPVDAPREQVAILLSACTRAKRGSECVLAADVANEATSAVAIVTWQGSSRALVEVGLRREGRSEWRTRTLEFDPGKDEPLERWRAVGLVVGTLANEELEQERPTSAAPEGAPAQQATKPATKPAEAAGRRAKPERSEPNEDGGDDDDGDDREYEIVTGPSYLGPVRARLDLGAAAGPALEAMRFGGLVRAELRLPDPIRLQLTTRYLERPSSANDLRAQWITVSLGLGLGFGGERAEVSFAVDGRGEYFGARAERGSDSEAATRWLSGMGFGATAAWLPSSTLGFFAGGDLAVMFGSTDVRVEDQSLGRDGELRYAAEAGVRFRLR